MNEVLPGQFDPHIQGSAVRDEAGASRESRIMKDMTCIEDLRRVARRKVPRAFFGYAEAGSYSGETLRANRADLERVRLRQRACRCFDQEYEHHNPGREFSAAGSVGADRHWRTSAGQW